MKTLEQNERSVSERLGELHEQRVINRPERSIYSNICALERELGHIKDAILTVQIRVAQNLQ